MLCKKNIHYLCEDGIEKSFPYDHHLSSLGKPCDAKWLSSGRIFQSHPHTDDRFLQSLLLYSFLQKPGLKVIKLFSCWTWLNICKQDKYNIWEY